jgi:hypothetical protein
MPLVLSGCRPPATRRKKVSRRSTSKRLKMARRDIARDPDIDLSTLAILLAADLRRAGQPAAARRDAVKPPEQHVIAFLAANPSGTHALRLGSECAAIQRELKLAPHRRDFRVESRWAVTIDDAIAQLDELDPAVVHFSGHGEAGSLLLEDEHGGPEPVSPRALAMMIEVAARNARVVILSACSTTAHAHALRDKVDVVIGMDGKIHDDAARMFAVRFYGALGNRRSVGNAFAQGVAKLAAKGLPDELLPCCVTRPGVDADQVVLTTCDGLRNGH